MKTGGYRIHSSLRSKLSGGRSAKSTDDTVLDILSGRCLSVPLEGRVEILRLLSDVSIDGHGRSRENFRRALSVVEMHRLANVIRGCSVDERATYLRNVSSWQLRMESEEIQIPDMSGGTFAVQATYDNSVVRRFLIDGFDREEIETLEIHKRINVTTHELGYIDSERLVVTTDDLVHWATEPTTGIGFVRRNGKIRLLTIGRDGRHRGTEGQYLMAVRNFVVGLGLVALDDHVFTGCPVPLITVGVEDLTESTDSCLYEVEKTGAGVVVWVDGDLTGVVKTTERLGLISFGDYLLAPPGTDPEKLDTTLLIEGFVRKKDRKPDEGKREFS